jgi:hypothetical protein
MVTNNLISIYISWMILQQIGLDVFTLLAGSERGYTSYAPHRSAVGSIKR